MWGATRPRRDHRRAVARQAGDTVDAGGLKGFGPRHRRQDGGQPPSPPRRPHPSRAEEQQVMNTMPALPSSLPYQGPWQPHEDLAV